MRGKRLVSLTVAGLGLLALAATPAAAATSNSLNAINGVSNVLLAAALPITILVEAALFYTVWKFRKSDEPKPTKENRRLEITWTAATAVVLLFVGLAAYGGLAAPGGLAATGDSVNDTVAQEDPVVVDVIAYQWGWRFEYPVGNETVTVNATERTLDNFTVNSQLVLPDDRTIVLRLHSEDVLHAVHVPQLGLKQDVMPSRVNVLQTTLNDAERDKPYVLYCAEFCGAAHSQMLGTVKVVNSTEYKQFLVEHGATNTTATNASA